MHEASMPRHGYDPVLEKDVNVAEQLWAEEQLKEKGTMNGL